MESHTPTSAAGRGCNGCFLLVGLLTWTAVVLPFDIVLVGALFAPDVPGESLLGPGLTGHHVALLWFLTPFNVVMVGGWVHLPRLRRPFDPDDARCVRRTASGWRVRVPGLGRAGCFGACLLGITFAGSFVWAFGWRFNPPVALAGGLYITAVVLAALAARMAERPWFEVDEAGRAFRLPAAGSTYEVPFAAVFAVTVTHEETRDSDGDVTNFYHCELVRTGGAVVRVATYREPAPAEALAAWLRERVRLAR